MKGGEVDKESKLIIDALVTYYEENTLTLDQNDTILNIQLMETDANDTFLMTIVAPQFELTDNYVRTSNGSKQKMNRFVMKIFFDQKVFDAEHVKYRHLYQKSRDAGHMPPLCPEVLFHRWYTKGHPFLHHITFPIKNQVHFPKKAEYGVFMLEYTGIRLETIILSNMNLRFGTKIPQVFTPALLATLEERCNISALKKKTYAELKVVASNVNSQTTLVDLFQLSGWNRDCLNDGNTLEPFLRDLNHYWYEEVVPRYLIYARRVLIRLAQLGFYHNNFDLKSISITDDHLFYLTDVAACVYDKSNQLKHHFTDPRLNMEMVDLTDMMWLCGSRLTPSLPINQFILKTSDKSENENLFLRYCVTELLSLLSKTVAQIPEEFKDFVKTYRKVFSFQRFESNQQKIDFIYDLLVRGKNEPKHNLVSVMFELADRKSIESSVKKMLNLFWRKAGLLGWVLSDRSPFELRYIATARNKKIRTLSEKDYILDVNKRIVSTVFRKSKTRVCATTPNTKGGCQRHGTKKMRRTKLAWTR